MYYNYTNLDPYSTNRIRSYGGLHVEGHPENENPSVRHLKFQANPNMSCKSFNKQMQPGSCGINCQDIKAIIPQRTQTPAMNLRVYAGLWLNENKWKGSRHVGAASFSLLITLRLALACSCARTLWLSLPLSRSVSLSLSPALCPESIRFFFSRNASHGVSCKVCRSIVLTTLSSGRVC